MVVNDRGASVDRPDVLGCHGRDIVDPRHPYEAGVRHGAIDGDGDNDFVHQVWSLLSPGDAAHVKPGTPEHGVAARGQTAPGGCERLPVGGTGRCRATSQVATAPPQW